MKQTIDKVIQWAADKDLLKKVRNYQQILESAKLRPQDFFIPNTYKVFPIPLSALQGNPNLTQNPGY